MYLQNTGDEVLMSCIMWHENFTSDFATAIKSLKLFYESVNVLEVVAHTVVEYRHCSAFS